MVGVELVQALLEGLVGAVVVELGEGLSRRFRAVGLVDGPLERRLLRIGAARAAVEPVEPVAQLGGPPQVRESGTQPVRLRPGGGRQLAPYVLDVRVVRLRGVRAGERLRGGVALHEGGVRAQLAVQQVRISAAAGLFDPVHQVVPGGPFGLRRPGVGESPSAC